MNLSRDDMAARAADKRTVWDFLVIGGGATGMGVAVDAAARGLSVLLADRDDFGKGTSSRSTKLVHGGVRYLQQGNISLVLEALKERGLMRENAPHLVHDLPFIVPNYTWWEAPFYGIGLRVYDLLAGKHGFGPSRNLTVKKTIERIPTIETEGLRGGVIYYDGQFDDARLLINLMQTAAAHGAAVVNHMEAVRLLKKNGVVCGAALLDRETGKEHSVKARVVINATGPFVDGVRGMDEPGAAPMIRPSQGVHIVLDRAFLPGDSAIMVPHTDDGRVLFAIPWHGRTLVGTTDTPIDAVSEEPAALESEVEFLLTHTARYLTRDPDRGDVLSVFAGIRPLVGGDAATTAALSRDHTLHISRSGLVTVTGGKWTTYRKMAEDTVDQAATVAQLDPPPCPTRTLRIHGYSKRPEEFGDLALYGADALSIRNLMRGAPGNAERIHPNFTTVAAEVLWAVRNEMARTVEDFLSRRTRALLLDAAASVEAAPRVAALMAKELGRDRVWEEEQLRKYTALAARYRL
ncbi:MAG: glycerol-3-phosphate dehydrogenase/oxidase [Candidatus Hydrogenedentes bacterium]|nr:glycerol-3-phosphate dehydrogenase/oxidase [Candidatus Hydrogenedentota bacterium]